MKAHTLHVKKFKTNIQSSVIHLFQSKLRFIILPLVFIILKIVGALWLFQRLEVGDFISLLHGWDSGHYANIVAYWYPPVPSEKWAFFPFYPFCAYLINLLLHDKYLATAIISFLAGIMWLPVFQSIAERYMGVYEAFCSAFIFASFPQVFLFTTVAYSESLFLLTTLLAWLLYIRGRNFWSLVFASFATLTRPYGILIVVPILLGLLKGKHWKKIPFILLPIASLFGWILYSFVKTRDYLAFVIAQEHWVGLGQPVNWFREFLLPQFASAYYPATWMHPLTMSYYLLPFIAVIAYLVCMSFDVDWKLGIYGVSSLVTILYFGTPISLSRFLPMIFPVWLNIRTKNIIIVSALCTFFYLHGLTIWYLFSSGVWMG